jgi:hypothetical protein
VLCGAVADSHAVDEEPDTGPCLTDPPRRVARDVHRGEANPEQFDPSVVLETLHIVEQQFAALRARSTEVMEALHGGDYDPLRRPAAELHQLLDATLATLADLKAHVVPGDGGGTTLESPSELLLRARRMVIIAALGRLRDALRDPAARAGAASWFVGRFQSIDELTTFLYDELHQISLLWTRYRKDAPQARAMVDAERRPLYCSALRMGRRALRDLGTQADVARVLHEGMAATGWPDVRAACMYIAAAFAIQIRPAGEPAVSVPRLPADLVPHGTPPL